MSLKKIPINTNLIKKRYYSTLYFAHTTQILKQYNDKHLSTMQFMSFEKEPYMLCGIAEVITIIKAFLTKKEFKSLQIKARGDGQIIQPLEPVLTITGNYPIFCELENIIDSVLARRSSVATNCWRILQYIKPEQLVYMSDRSDDYTLHPYDGYAAYVGGVRNFSNYSHIAFIDDKDVHVYGSMPHAMIQQYHGDINQVLCDYLKMFDEVSLLVDFDNDIIGTLKRIESQYWSHIHSIRLDTSQMNLDATLKQKGFNQKEDYGVSINLVKIVRAWLDKNNHSHVKIVATSDNNLNKVKNFIKHKVPVDFYGIGSALTALSLHFTADLVELDGQEYAKVGRKLLDQSKLIILK